MSEFNLIEHFRNFHPVERTDVSLPSGDDCAIMQVPPDHELVVTTDTMVAGRHFYTDIAPEDLGYKAISTSLSDLAAMGAEPTWLLISCTFPEINVEWMEGFKQGLNEIPVRENIQIVGGDITQGPLSITTTAHGIIPQGTALTRYNAKVGDDLYVSGFIGDAGIAINNFGEPYSALTHEDISYLENRLNRPEARISLGSSLRSLAHSAIDISDGLMGDLKHIMHASKVGINIDIQKIPLSLSLQKIDHEDAIQAALCSGDDYELCFSADPKNRRAIQELSLQLRLPLTIIGQVTQQADITFSNADSITIENITQGYEHFTVMP